MNKLSKRLRNLIKWVIIPVVLFLLWVGLSLQFINQQGGITVLYKSHDSNSFLQLDTGKLHKGERVNATFTASENNLGIVAVRFNTYSRINDDEVIFRIREQGQNKWLYQNSYTVAQFQSNKHFTFGFPTIANSKGKKYEFQIESVKGNNTDAVSISPDEPIFVSKYQFEKQTLISSTSEAVNFVIKKLANSFADISFLISTSMYLLPLVLYVLWLLFFEKYLARKYYLVFIPLIFLLLASIFLAEISQLIMIIGILIWTFILAAYKLESRISFLLAILFLAISTIAIILSINTTAQNASVWAYVFLVIGAIQQIIEIKYGDKNLITYNMLIKKMRKIEFPR